MSDVPHLIIKVPGERGEGRGRREERGGRRGEEGERENGVGRGEGSRGRRGGGGRRGRRDVLFLWSIIMVNWNEDISNTALDLIVDMWITIRGFAQANAWMELYKKEQKKSMQKTKGLRKQLIAHVKLYM